MAHTLGGGGGGGANNMQSLIWGQKLKISINCFKLTLFVIAQLNASIFIEGCCSTVLIFGTKFLIKPG